MCSYGDETHALNIQYNTSPSSNSQPSSSLLLAITQHTTLTNPVGVMLGCCTAQRAVQWSLLTQYNTSWGTETPSGTSQQANFEAHGTYKTPQYKKPMRQQLGQQIYQTQHEKHCNTLAVRAAHPYEEVKLLQAIRVQSLTPCSAPTELLHQVPVAAGEHQLAQSWALYEPH